MSNNKTIKDKMKKKYGEECMIEAADIRYIPNYINLKGEGRSKEDNRLTYHHLKPVCERWGNNYRKRSSNKMG